MNERMAYPAPAEEPDPRIVRIHAELADLEVQYRRYGRRWAWLVAGLPVLALYVVVLLAVPLWLALVGSLMLLGYMRGKVWR